MYRNCISHSNNLSPNIYRFGFERCVHGLHSCLTKFSEKRNELYKYWNWVLDNRYCWCSMLTNATKLSKWIENKRKTKKYRWKLICRIIKYLIAILLLLFIDITFWCVNNVQSSYFSGSVIEVQKFESCSWARIECYACAYCDCSVCRALFLYLLL